MSSTAYNSDGYPRQQSASQNRGNFISSVGFVMNMGYPPPPIGMDRLKNLIIASTENLSGIPTSTEFAQIKMQVTEKPFPASTTVLFHLQQGLHSSRMERISCSLEVLAFLGNELKIAFLQHINKEFMKSMHQVIKTNSYKDRTVTGSLKKVEKWLTGSQSSNSVATDPRVQSLQKRTLQIIQQWVDLTIEREIDVPHIHASYRKLRGQGFGFPMAEEDFPSFVTLNEAFLAGSVPSRTIGFGNTSSFSNVPQSYPSFPNKPKQHGSGILKGPAQFDENAPITDKQIENLKRAMDLFNEPGRDASEKERCIATFKKMIPKIDSRIQQLVDNPGEFLQEQKLQVLFDMKDEMDAAINVKYSDNPMESLEDMINGSRGVFEKTNNNDPFHSTSKSMEPIESSSDIPVETPELIIEEKEKVDDPFAALDDVFLNE